MPHPVNAHRLTGALCLAALAAAIALPAAAQTPSDALPAPAPAPRQTPPAGGTPRDFTLPARQSFSLPNGLTASLVAYGSLPKAAVSVRVRTGNIDEAPDAIWLADLTGELMSEGTEGLDAEALGAAVAGMGGTLDITTSFDGTFVSTDVLAEFAPQAVRLLADVVRRPRLPDSELPRLKDDLVRELEIALSQPQPLADRRFAELLYPDHPYGRLYPTEAMIRGYGVEAVVEHFRANFGAQRTAVYVAGVFDAAATEQAIRESFADWERGPAPTRNVPGPATRSQPARRIHLVDRPGAVQTTLRIGLPVPDPSSPDHMALTVTNALLGGMFSSRITSNIREDKGYTYSPGSAVTARYRSAHWAETADVTTDVTGPSLKEIFHEIDRLQAEPPPAAELAGVHSYLAGVFVLQNSSRGGIIGQLWFVDLHGLSESYLTEYVRNVYAVTAEDVQRVARQLLRDEEMTVVAVGDRAKIEAQVQPFGELAE